ncbi:MAG: DUF6163 family protein [Methylocella sp.]
MKILRGSEKIAERGDSGAAIRLGDSGEGGEKNAWGLVLVVFMRLLAALCVAQGLSQWSAVLLPHRPLFDTVTPDWGAAVIFFAILDLLAAVGLWLATPWGGVLWLFRSVAQIFVALTIPSFFGPVWIAANCVLILAYFALTLLAGRPDVNFRLRRRK